MFGPGSIFFGSNTSKPAPATTIIGADNGLTAVANIAQLGQVTGAIGDPAKLLHNSEIPFDGFTLAFTQIGGAGVVAPGSFLIIRTGASFNHESPIVQFQDSTTAEVASLRMPDSTGIFFGFESGASFTGLPGTRSVAIGTNTLQGCPISFENVAIGFFALADNSGNGIQNSAVGSGSMQSNISGGQNAAFGWNSLNNNQSGSGNMAVGPFSLNGVITAGNNVGIGSNCGTVSDESNNVFIGGGAAAQQAFGSGNTILGANADFDSIIGNNNIIIGFGAQEGGIGGVIANTTLIGVGQTSILSNIVALGIATQNILLGFTAPAVDTGARLQVNGQIQTTGPVTTAGKFRVGLEVAAAVVVDTTKYIEFENNGVVYKLITAV
jgi:hypothetical protein